MLPASTKGGAAVLAFPDVCKTPTLAGPVPIPYPNTGTQTKSLSTSLKVAISPTKMRTTQDTSFGTVLKQGATAGQLRSQLQLLHAQIIGLPGGNPNRWHELVDQYVIATAQLYIALTE